MFKSRSGEAVLDFVPVKHFAFNGSGKRETVFDIAYFVQDLLHFLRRCKELRPLSIFGVTETHDVAIITLSGGDILFIIMYLNP